MGAGDVELGGDIANKGENPRHLMLRQERNLHIKLTASVGELRGSVLRDQDEGR
jgi:hypothetical protein